MSETLSVKIDEELMDHVKSIGNGNQTRGISIIIKEHLEGKVKGDLREGLLFLMQFVKAIEFKDSIEL